MNRDGIQSLANAGRFGDTELIHATKGEVVIPPTIMNKNPSLVQAIRAELAKENTSLDEVTVGSSLASINPETGLQEFFLKKLFKGIKNVGSKLVKGFKKVAPVAGALLIPGVGGALSGVLAGAGSALGIPAGLGSSFLGGSGVLQTLGNARAGIGSLLGLSGSGPAGGGPMGGGSSGSSGGGLGSFLSGLGGLKSGFEEATGLDPAALALATAFGKATERALEKEAGGMSDIRGTIRPDLAQKTYGGAPTFNVGFAAGGSVFADEEVTDMRQGGESIGPGTGTSDDIPAMLSDGEFVMTAKANRGAGALNMKKGKDGIMQLIPQGKADRQKGADNMMSLMKYFEGLA